MSKANGTSNGTHAPPVAVTSAVEIETTNARLRTALVALVDMAKREGWHRKLQDEMLLEEIEWLLGESNIRK